MLENFFKLQEHKTDVKTELVAGLTTFMTIAYILIVNPSMLGKINGMSFEQVFYATAFAAIVGTLSMAFLANYPFALAPAMGLNAFFTFSVVLSGKLSWQGALTAVFIEGIVFIVLTFVNIREALFNAIPLELKFAVTGGIGLFIALIGFKNANIVVDHPVTLVTITHHFTSIEVLLAILGILVISVLIVRKIKGAILIGILSVWILTMIFEAGGIYVPNNTTTFSAIPKFSLGGSGIADMNWFKFDFSGLGSFDFWVIMISFLFVDLFDTIGTLIGVSDKAGYLDKDGKLPKAKQALFADAIATTAGACMGTSTTTTYVESAAGVAAGGRTGLTSVTTAILFALALPFASVFSAIPAFATAPALIIVGFYMIGSITKIDFSTPEIGIPAFFTLIIMPITYSISDGIAFGVISFTLIHALSGKFKKIHPLMYILTILFILKYIFI